MTTGTRPGSDDGALAAQPDGNDLGCSTPPASSDQPVVDVPEGHRPVRRFYANLSDL